MAIMQFDQSKYKVQNWKNPLCLHYLINPVVAFNELILGQRIPKKVLIDLTSDKPFMERSIVPCPHCKTLHDGQTWSDQNGTMFKNWFGLYCSVCNEIIPCLRNLTAALVLIITYPFWFWWIDGWRNSWIRNQPKRYSQLKFETDSYMKVNWFRMGLLWAAIMCGLMNMVLPFIIGRNYNWTYVLITLPIWTIAGFAFVYTMKWHMGHRANRKRN